MSIVATILSELKGKSTPERAKASKWFFKTGKGEYGEGDVFLGLAVPDVRKIALKFTDCSMSDISQMLQSKIHDVRQSALFILVKKFEKGDEKIKKQIFDLYLKNTKRVNNWDLVDLSAPKIISRYLLNKPRDILYKLARSKNLWEKRIAIMGTAEFIRQGDFNDTLKISEILLNDSHDLIHKAVGWMLREVGNRSLVTEEKFLEKHLKNMPRTMLRYAIEKFPESKRKAYLTK
jgi:3-methyladenine DNA glycosylase AlkD